MSCGEHEKAAKTECDTEPVALIHAAWLEKSLTIGAAEAATELRRLHEVEKQRDELLAVFSLVFDEIEKRDRGNGNAPGHAHEIPGVWDSDNGALAGKPCAWCTTWNKAKELRDRMKGIAA